MSGSNVMVNIGTCNAGRPLDAFLVVVAALPTRAGNVSLPACLLRPTEAHHTYALATDYGRMIAIFQNHIWDIYHGLDLKSSGKNN